MIPKPTCKRVQDLIFKIVELETTIMIMMQEPLAYVLALSTGKPMNMSMCMEYSVNICVHSLKCLQEEVKEGALLPLLLNQI